MFTLRCTKRLLDRMRVAPEPSLAAPTTCLGDWYANLCYTSRGQMILCVSERTLLPVLLPARDSKSIPLRLPAAAAEMLHALGISSDLIAREVGEMAPAAVGKTIDRRVLGSMNDFAFMANFDLDAGIPPGAVARRLAEAPCKPIEMESPDRATIALFARSLH